ncbi:PIG-L deacetylase family protein [Flavisphingomonas formosensis]|uniref:PIG-L deacetylase family protein n=1 Tax=Flavisphingomonas formosensis TaxID=861534 RepID=UPI0012F9EEA0|nr:PIG-L deacetylase family protein [Sphingomonas formosensis]
MTMLSRIRRALVIAPHPDDEILGCGGTMAAIVAGGGEVHVVIVTRGQQPRFDVAQAEQVYREAKRAHQHLGIAETHFLGLPAAELDRLPHADLNAAIAGVVKDVRPDTLFVPFVGDLHMDHRLVFEAAMVAARPRGGSYPQRILAYETVSETNWSAPTLAPAFHPNVFVEITDFLDAKLNAFACFVSQCQPFPDERSIETLSALAAVRGSTVTREAAEAFMLIREVS